MENKGILSSFSLKWIAIITMAIDHVGAILFPEQMLFRYIGRLAFPIFAFLIVEGFYNTSNVRRYEKRLLLFALISEIPFDLAFYGEMIYWGHQNVFFTLAIGLILLDVLANAQEHPNVRMVGCLVAMLLAYALRTDYNAAGIIFIMVFYLLRQYKVLKVLGFSLVNILCYGANSVQVMAVFATVPIAMYNGKKGPSMKYFFYIFYPLHLLLLYGVKTVVL